MKEKKTKSEQIGVRLTPEQREELRRRAAAINQTESGYLVLAMLEKFDRDPPPKRK